MMMTVFLFLIIIGILLLIAVAVILLIIASRNKSNHAGTGNKPREGTTLNPQMVEGNQEGMRDEES